MSLRTSYTLLAPIYDPLVASATRGFRRTSLKALDTTAPSQRVLLAGIGSGLDLPELPAGPLYIGMDLTPAMLRRAQQRNRVYQNTLLHCGDVHHLPYRDASFDTVLMHLILAVVPDPHQALAEVVRVLKPGGHLHVVDKFLRPGQRAWLRRSLSLVLRHIATRTDVVFEELHAGQRSLTLLHEQNLEPSGWFRFLRLQKTFGPHPEPPPC
ncbi:MAG: class I SAM-dependent methyltransferase [Gammaproteobacteria bacterium]